MDESKVKQLVSQLAEAVDITGPTSGAPPLTHLTPINLIADQHARAVRIAEAVVDGRFKDNYWNFGEPGAVRGALFAHWQQSLLYAGHGEIPAHMTVIIRSDVNDPAGNLFAEHMATAADVGWIDGEGYTFDPELQGTQPAVNFQRWVAAGCPHRNSKLPAGWAYGMGVPARTDAWDQLYARIAAQGS
jgi:hypothetical protein